MLKTDGRLKLARNAKSYDDGAKGKRQTNKQTAGRGKRKRQREGKGKRDEDRQTEEGKKRQGRRDGRGGQLPPAWFYVTASPV